MPRGRLRRVPARESRRAPDGGPEIRVLVVDDYAFVRAGLRAMLEAETAIQVVAEVESADAAKSRWTGPLPDVAVMPVMTGRRAGTQAVSQIRAKWSDIRVLVLIPAGNEDALFASIRAGASGYVPMEVSAANLAHAVRAVAAGQGLIDPTVIQKVRRSDAIEDKLARLSLDEQRVLELLAQGQTNREIANRLGQSLATAKKRVSSILTKLGVKRRAEAAAYLAQRLQPGEGDTPAADRYSCNVPLLGYRDQCSVL
jgi:two-component system response regulator DevR